MRRSTASAAASHERASSIASSTVSPHGWNRSRSGGSPRYSRSRSGRPAASSSAVWRAIAHAACTVRSIASGERSEVLALPRRLPKYTVTARPLSRLYSTVSTSPRRTVTDWPTAAETSTSASLAPRRCAASSERRATSAIASCDTGKPATGTGWSGKMEPPMEDDDFISKTRRKKQMRELQDVGAALVSLSADQLARLDLPEEL